MNLEARKISIVKNILNLENENLISKIESFLNQNQLDISSHEVSPMSLEHFNNEIDTAMEDSKNENMTKVSELKAKYQKWK